VPAGVDTVTARLDAGVFDTGIFGEGLEYPDGVVATSDTGHDGIWVLASLFENLGIGLVTDDGLESSDDGRGVEAKAEPIM
jgi:hypothetical protein